MQRLVTISLTSSAYRNGGVLSQDMGADTFGTVHEHLKDELAAGWRIVSVSATAAQLIDSRAVGWLAVVLERDETEAAS